MAAVCMGCYGDPKTTIHNCGFKRETVICDKGCGNVSISLHYPNILMRFIGNYSYDSEVGFIKYKNSTGQWFFCSLLCLNSKVPILKLAEGMNDYDKEGIITQLKKDVEKYNSHVKWFQNVKLEPPQEEPETVEEPEIVEEDYTEEENDFVLSLALNKELQEKLKACEVERLKASSYSRISEKIDTILVEKLKTYELENKQQKELLQKIQADENIWKEIFEQKKQKEIDKLKETIKAKDREIFCLIARNMELERKCTA